ncbi:ABC transporter ATP-binding protein [Glycomyces scopariae]
MTRPPRFGIVGRMPTHTNDRTATAVRLQGVRKVYGTGSAAVTALDGLSIAFAPAEFTAIMGPSGSGKSTLMLCAAGLDEPDAGQVKLGSVDLAGLGDRERARVRRERTGFVFQSYNLVPTLPAWMNVALPGLMGGGRPDRRAVDDVLARVGIAGTARRLPAQLSGGQQQRVAVARAVLARPAVLFADEPTGALDTAARDEVLALLRGLAADHGTTIVMVTHDPVVAAAADRVVFLRDGRLAGDAGARSAAELGRELARLGGAA